MKKRLICICVSIFLFSSLGYAAENCCGKYSAGNDFICGPHDNNSLRYGNCTWYARYKRPEVEGICTQNASQWFIQAKNGGLSTGQIPVVGSIAVFNSWMYINGVYTNAGHVAYVESVNANGSFYVSEMGWNTWDCVHTNTYTNTSFGGLVGFIYPVGYYSDGFHSDGTTKAFIDTYKRFGSKLGGLVDSGGDTYVHKWQGQIDKTYRIWLQDFQGDMNSSHFGTDGKTAIILNDFFKPYKAYLVKEGMWGFYKNNNGPFAFGEPFTEEITFKFADSPYNQSGDPVKAGETITVQKFMRIFDFGGQPAFNNERRTLVYNKSTGGNVTHFPVVNSV
jgi:surface antigen